MDLIRLLLMRSAGHEVSQEIEKYTVEEKAFHIALMKDAGYVIAVIQNDASGQIIGAVTSRLTWQGYEALQLMLDKNTWNKAKKAIIDTGLPWATPLVLQWLKLQACSHIPGLANFLPSDHS